jgi:hypothetical protein
VWGGVGRVSVKEGTRVGGGVGRVSVKEGTRVGGCVGRVIVKEGTRGVGCGGGCRKSECESAPVSVSVYDLASPPPFFLAELVRLVCCIHPSSNILYSCTALRFLSQDP